MEISEEIINKECPYCGKIFKARGIHHHIQRIHEGKIVKYNSGNRIVWTEERRKRTSEDMKAYRKAFQQVHSEETRKKISEKALASKHRRLQRNVIKYKKPSGEIVLLDSSWEEKIAIFLDENKIIWERPNPLSWVDKNGKNRNYFPDFFLPIQNLFIDPKNKHAAMVQKEKIDYIKSHYNNVVFLTSIEEIDGFLVSLK